jgi:hypothetical protein
MCAFARTDLVIRRTDTPRHDTICRESDCRSRRTKGDQPKHIDSLSTFAITALDASVAGDLPRSGVVTAPAIFIGQEIFGVNADRRQTCDEFASLRRRSRRCF